MEGFELVDGYASSDRVSLQESGGHAFVRLVIVERGPKAQVSEHPLRVTQAVLEQLSDTKNRTNPRLLSQLSARNLYIWYSDTHGAKTLRFQYTEYPYPCCDKSQHLVDQSAQGVKTHCILGAIKSIIQSIKNTFHKTGRNII